MNKPPPLPFGVRRKWDKVILEIHGKEIEARFIGRGLHSIVYAVDKKDVYIYTHYDDQSKQIMLEAKDNAIRCSSLPPMQLLDFIDSGTEQYDSIQLFKSKYYQTITYNDFAWDHMNMLRKLWVNTYTDVIKDDSELPKMGPVFNSVFYNRCCNPELKLPKYILSGIKSLVWSSIGYGAGYMFDKPAARNTGIDGQGRLVFLDPIFNVEQWYKNREAGRVEAERIANEKGEKHGLRRR